MDPRPARLELGVFAVALVVLLVGAAGGPTWDLASGHAVLAAQLERTAGSPLYGLLADLAAQLPAGEVGFRLGVLSAVLGAATLAGVVAAARALLPKDPLAGVTGAALLFLAPPFRDAAGFASPSMLAACGLVWAVAGAAAHARAKGLRELTIALAGAAAVIGSAPWLGLPVAIAIVAWLARAGARRDRLAIGVGAIGLAIVAWWIGALGGLPGFEPSLAAMVAATGRGAAAIVVGAGLLGAAFGAVTGLPPARWLVLAIALAALHAIVVDPAPAPLLALLAIGCAVIPSAIARSAFGGPRSGAGGGAEVNARAVGSERRTLVVALAGVPLVAAALLAGPAFGVDDPGDAPARLATDLAGEVPSGPGVVVATNGTMWSALEYARVVAGARPDLALAPPLPETSADALVADALRAKQLAASDVPAFGRLDPTRAVPRGRGFELRGEAVDVALPPPPPAAYASAIGARTAITLAINRARFEAGNGHLDAAARAAGLTERFGAAGLAMLATTAPTRERPALWGFLPRLDGDAAPDDPARWRLDLFGDDLAWVAGIDQPLVAAPPLRHLHGLWRELLSGKRTAGDPDIAALGPAAVAATKDMLAATRPAK